MTQAPLIYTTGHANHEVADFIDLLHQHAISLVVDVRSQPYSRWASQFNHELLAHDLKVADIAYRFMGDALGGRPTPLCTIPARIIPTMRAWRSLRRIRSGSIACSTWPAPTTWP
jgi:hypothetical protein